MKTSAAIAALSVILAWCAVSFPPARAGDTGTPTAECGWTLEYDEKVHPAVCPPRLWKKREIIEGCPQTWTFDKNIMPLEYIDITNGIVNLDGLYTQVWINEGPSSFENWKLWDFRWDGLKYRPIFFICDYGKYPNIRQLIVRMPDAAEICGIYFRELAGGQNQELRSSRCSLPDGDARAEVFVPGPLDANADIRGLALRRTEAESKAAAEARGGQWSARAENGEIVGEALFPDKPERVVVHFSATTGRSREVTGWESKLSPKTLYFLMVSRFGALDADSCSDPDCSYIQDTGGVRIEYWENHPDGVHSILRLFDLNDPATRPSPAQ